MADFEHLFTLDSKIDTTVAEPKPSGRGDTEERIKNLKEEAGQGFISRVKEIMDDKKALTAKAAEVSEVPEGLEIHDYMEFNDTVAKAAVEAIAEQMFEGKTENVHAIVASDKNTNWMNQLEDALKKDGDERRVVVVVFGRKFNRSEFHKSSVQVEQRLREHTGWKTVKEPSSDTLPPHQVNKEAWDKAFDRMLCIAKP